MDMTPIVARGARAAGRRRASGLVLAAAVGRETIDDRLVALKSLRDALGRGEVLLVDDGTLDGIDRVRLARQCGDPQFVAASTLEPRGFPDGAEWARLAAALTVRREAYCVLVAAPFPPSVVPRLEEAIASNRSFALLDDAPLPGGLEPHLGTLAREGWRCLRASPDLVGFAAGGDGAALAATVLDRLEAVLGAARARHPEMARAVTDFVLARERAPMRVPLPRSGSGQAASGSFTGQDLDAIAPDHDDHGI